MNEMKRFIRKQFNAIFSRVFTSFLISEPRARSAFPLSQREPEMPKEILDSID